MPVTAYASPRLIGRLQLPGDKSITHRAMLFAALCQGECEVAGAAMNKDCQATICCLQNLGLKIEIAPNEIVRIVSPGLAGLQLPKHTLEVGNSATTMRLLSGLLAGTNLTCRIDGDQSIRKRPMRRIFEPLELMGAQFSCLEEPDYAPFELKGKHLNAVDYCSPIASAQVETAFVLAALQAEGTSTIKLPLQVRDHTTRLLQYAGAPVELNGTSISINKLKHPLAPYRIMVPGDISSAAFLMVAAALLPGSDIVLLGVGINPGRRLIIDAMLKMGADLQVENLCNYAQEPTADIRVKYSPNLKGITIHGDQIPLGIDEIPALALLGCFCQGVFCVQGATELRYKESNRLQITVENLRFAGVTVTEQEDGFEITGKGSVSSLKGGCNWMTRGDHRLAMTGIIAGLLADEFIKVDDTKCIDVSYPAFEDDLQKLLC